MLQCVRIMCHLSSNFRDVTNDNRYVFLGYCESNMSAMKAAEKVYKQAIEVNPRASLAWQGLLTVYEKEENVAEYLSTAKALTILYKDL